MRLEVKGDGDGTVFAFLDTWAEGTESGGQGELARLPGGPGTPWPGVAAGWRHMVDTLQTVATGVNVGHSYEELCDFYVGYLGDLYRWSDAAQGRARTRGDHGSQGAGPGVCAAATVRKRR